MPRKQKIDNSIPEFLVVEDPAAIKLLFTPKYATIIKLLELEELSISDIARKLDINPGSAHYHIKILEKYGLVKLVREEIQGGVVKKFYRKAARNLPIDIGPPAAAKAASAVGIDEQFIDKLIKYMGLFGYPIPDEKLRDAKVSLLKGDARMKAILRELQQVGLEKIEADRDLVSNVYQIALIIRLIDDAEFYGSVKAMIGMASGNTDKECD